MKYVFILFICIFFCQNSRYVLAQIEGVKTMRLTSTTFEEGGMIPAKYSCDSMDVSPPLSWESIPDGTKSLALIPQEKGLSENIPAQSELPNGARQGINDFRKIGYGGPCPPSGMHRYFFKLYALDTIFDLEGDPTKADLEEAMHGHIIAQCQLMGKYQR
jgi:phosphatidylethanolamine-binding protein (PEBP) family uncharacterized protein